MKNQISLQSIKTLQTGSDKIQVLKKKRKNQKPEKNCQWLQKPGAGSPASRETDASFGRILAGERTRERGRYKSSGSANVAVIRAGAVCSRGGWRSATRGRPQGGSERRRGDRTEINEGREKAEGYIDEEKRSRRDSAELRLAEVLRGPVEASSSRGSEPLAFSQVSRGACSSIVRSPPCSPARLSAPPPPKNADTVVSPYPPRGRRKLREWHSLRRVSDEATLAVSADFTCPGTIHIYVKCTCICVYIYTRIHRQRHRQRRCLVLHEDSGFSSREQPHWRSISRYTACEESLTLGNKPVQERHTHICICICTCLCIYAHIYRTEKQREESSASSDRRDGVVLRRTFSEPGGVPASRRRRADRSVCNTSEDTGELPDPRAPPDCSSPYECEAKGARVQSECPAAKRTTARKRRIKILGTDLGR